MTTQIQRRRGTTAQHSTFTGAVGEVTVDTDKEVLVVHDGAEVGGYPQMRENGSNSALALGSAGTPSLKFAGDTNTGIYSPGADQVAISTGGSGRLFVDAGGRLLVGANSTSGASTYYDDIVVTNTTAGTGAGITLVANATNGFNAVDFGDTDATGRGRITYSHADDSLRIDTAGAERLRITSAGLVGVGTSSPGTKLHVAGSGQQILRIQDTGNTNGFDLGNNTTESFISTADNKPITFYTNNLERAKIDSSGRVGIGTSAPGAKLTIQQAANTVLEGLLLVASSGSVNGGWYHNGSALVGREGGFDTINLAAGKVGIGTTSPAQVLDVQGGANRTPIAFKGNGSGTGYLYADNSSFGVKTSAGSLTATDAFVGVDTANTILFITSGTEKAKFDSSGRLLVGTSSDSQTSTLVLQGNSGASNDASLIRLCRGTNAPADGAVLGYLVWGDSGHTAAAWVAGVRDGGTWTSGTSQPTRLVFSTTADGASSPTERMRITSSSDPTVVIGNQDYTKSHNLEFYSFSPVTNSPGIGGRIRCADVGSYSQALSFWIHNGTSTSGSDIVEAMRINSGSELLIGYTADNGAYKLQVNSQIFATSSTVATSDGRYKENVATLSGCVDLVKALRPVSFTWKPQEDITRIDDKGNEVLVREGHNFPDGTQVGFIAQEVQEVLAEKPWLTSIIKQNVRPAVTDAEGNELAPEEEFLGIAEGNLISVLTSALQEAIGEIESLKARVVALESA